MPDAAFRMIGPASAADTIGFRSRAVEFQVAASLVVRVDRSGWSLIDSRLVVSDPCAREREREKEGERERASEKRGGDKEGESTTRTATKERHGEEWEEREGKSTAAFFYERFDAVSRMEKALARL